MRLRGIGGLIVVDFIHLNEPDNIEKVLDVLADSLSKDHTPTQISPMSEFGLVEITRKRVRDPLVKLMSECCRSCSGHGRKRTRDSVALEVMRSVERTAAAAPGKPIVVRASRRSGALAGRSRRRSACRAGPPRCGARGVRGAMTHSRAKGFDVATAPDGGGTCPICGKPRDAKFRPFCSKRCADLDLAKWLRGGYAIPGAPSSEEQRRPGRGRRP